MQIPNQNPLSLEIEIVKNEIISREIELKLQAISTWSKWANLKASHVAKSLILLQNSSITLLSHRKSLNEENTNARVELVSVIRSQKNIEVELAKVNQILESLKKEANQYGQIREISDYRRRKSGV